MPDEYFIATEMIMTNEWGEFAQIIFRFILTDTRARFENENKHHSKMKP